MAAALLLLAASLPVSIAATNISLGILTAALLARRSSREKAFRIWHGTPAVWGMLLYCLAGFTASCFGVDPAHSLRDNSKDLHKLWTLLALTYAFSEEEEPHVWTALAAGFAIVVAAGLGQTVAALLNRDPGFPIPRPHAFVHPVVYGEQLTLFLLGGACVFIHPVETLKRPAARPLAAGLLALTASVLVFNQTRSSIFALAAGGSAIYLLEPKSRRLAKWLALLLAAIVVIWEALPRGDRRSLLRLFVDFNPRDSNNARYVLWSVGWRMFREHPLTGVGPGHYGTLFTSYFDGALDNQRGWSSAHNLYLHQLAERGLVGAAGLAAALGTLLAGAWNSARRAIDARSLWAASAFSAFLVMNLTENAFQNEQVTTLILFAWAWGTTPRRARNEIL